MGIYFRNIDAIVEAVTTKSKSEEFGLVVRKEFENIRLRGEEIVSCTFYPFEINDDAYFIIIQKEEVLEIRFRNNNIQSGNVTRFAVYEATREWDEFDKKMDDTIKFKFVEPAQDAYNALISDNCVTCTES